MEKGALFSGSSLEIVPVTTANLYLRKGNVNECIIKGASFGRDCDTIARAVGCLAGAMHGASAIRQNWIETVEKVNEPLFEDIEGDRGANFRSMAQRLVAALRAERQAAQARVTMLEQLLVWWWLPTCFHPLTVLGLHFHLGGVVKREA